MIGSVEAVAWYARDAMVVSCHAALTDDEWAAGQAPHTLAMPLFDGDDWRLYHAKAPQTGEEE